MKKNRRLFIIVMLVLPSLFLTQSCESLDQDQPGVKDIELFFETVDDAQNALTGAYSNIRMETFIPKNFIITCIISTDDGDPGGQNESVGRVMNDLYSNNGYDGALLTCWYSGYNVINRAGMVIEKTPGVTGDEETKENIIGQARFLRNLIYFYFIQFYGDIPFYGDSYVDDPGGTIEMGRTPVNEIYNFMEEDLLKAIEGLPRQANTEKGRVSKGAAQALLAKIYLTRAGKRFDASTEKMVQGDSKYYQMASTLAQEIINGGDYSLCENYVDLFSVEGENSNPEAMFFINAQKGLSPELGLRQAGLQYLFRTRPKSNGWSSAVPDLELYYSFDTINDKRIDGTFLTHVYGIYDGAKLLRPEVEPPYTDENAQRFDYWWDGFLAPRPHIGKYLPIESEVDIATANVESSNNQHLIRYADVLLILAEAENEINGGPTALGENALNQVRTRAGLPSWTEGSVVYGKQVNYSNNYDGFTEAVRHERRLELCFEMNRRFDLLRWGTLVERIKSMPDIKAAAGIEVTEYDLVRAANIKETHKLMPLPQDECETYPNMYQNPGY